MAFRYSTLSHLTGVGLHNQEGQQDLVEKISTNALRYVRLIGEAADRLMPAATRTDLPEDIFDVLQRQVRIHASLVMPYAFRQQCKQQGTRQLPQVSESLLL